MQYNIQDIIKEVLNIENKIITTGDKLLLTSYLNTLTKVKTIMDKLEVILVKDFLLNNDLSQFRMTGNIDNMVTIIIAEGREKEIDVAAKDYKRLKILASRMYKFLETLPDSYLSVNIVDLENKK